MRTAIPLGLEKTVLNTIGQHLATTEELALGSKGERKRRREGEMKETEDEEGGVLTTTDIFKSAPPGTQAA